MNTSVIYTSEKISIEYKNESYSVLAKTDIKVGELLLLEHVLAGDMGYLCSSVGTNMALFDSLYPRKYSRDDIQEMETIIKSSQSTKEDEENWKKACKKVNMNCFKFSDDLVLGDAFSKFNHSCIPNCHMDKADKPELDNGFIVNIYGMWTHRSVKKNDELVIDYVNGASIQHDYMKSAFGFSCDCSTEYLLDAGKRSEVHKNLGAFFRERDSVFIKTAVDQYLKTSVASKVIENQVLGLNGYFFLPHHGLMITKSMNSHGDPFKEVKTIKDKVSKAIRKWNSQ